MNSPTTRKAAENCRSPKAAAAAFIRSLFLLPLVPIALAGPAVAGQNPFSRESIRATMRRVNEFQKAHPWRETDRNWIRATYYTGVMGAYQATKDPAYLEQARAWGEKHQWQVGTEKSGYNQLFCAMTWAELQLLDSDPKKIQPTIDWLKTDAPTSPGGSDKWFGHAGPHEHLWYSDSLYGAPVFPMLHKATGDQRYLDILHNSFRTVTDELLDPEDDLYYRDRSYIGKKSPNDRKILWARGNGWVFAGLPRILQHLPKDDPDYARYLDLYQNMAKSLAPRQHDDGLWRSNLGDPDHYLMPESSSTAFFTFGFASGINQGLLEKDAYLPTVIKGWAGLNTCIHPDGNMGWVQPVDAQPRPSLPITTHEYATGLFLLAGSEVLKLVESGLITPEVVERYTSPDDSILPPAARAKGPLATSDHPLADKITGFLARQQQATEFSPTGLARKDYLDVIAGQVKAMHSYQDSAGRIIDPVTKKEMYYATPCYAHSVATLTTAGRGISAELLESGMRALDVSIESLTGNSAAGGHGDFYTWPVMFAYEQFTPLAPDARKAAWRKQLAAMDIKTAYKHYRTPYQVYEHRKFYDTFGKFWAHNWNLLNSAGEFLRAGHGFTDLAYTDFCLTMQLPHFTPYGMYSEGGDPLAYDMFSRHYVAGMLHRGYRSFVYTTYRDLLWKGAWTSLFMQSPNGELPTGYRSSQHIWNEAEQSVVFEIYATHYAKAGRMAEAGAFKRAARLALGSVKNWIRPDGTGYVVKNRYPIEAKHGYERYSEHTCYNLLACSMLAQAWQFADDNIQEKPSPADLGGFVVIPPGFHKVFANVGGNYVEYETSGDLKYNPTGLLRIHLAGGHPQLGPSGGTGIGGSGSSLRKETAARENIAVGPEWKGKDDRWTRLAARQGSEPKVEVLEESPDKASFRVTWPDVSQTITVDRGGVTVEDLVTARDVSSIRVNYPMLVFDGATETDVQLNGNSVTLALGGKGVKFTLTEPAGTRLKRSGTRLKHRNGLVEAAIAEAPGTRMVYRITPR